MRRVVKWKLELVYSTEVVLSEIMTPREHKIKIKKDLIWQHVGINIIILATRYQMLANNCFLMSASNNYNKIKSTIININMKNSLNDF